jgi:hypothetical protein
VGQRGHCTKKVLYLYLWKRNENRQLGAGLFLVHQRTVSAIKRVEFVSDMMSYVVLRGRWFDTGYSVGAFVPFLTLSTLRMRPPVRMIDEVLSLLYIAVFRWLIIYFCRVLR